MTTERLVLGTVQLGMSYGIANKTGQPDQKMAAEILREAWESGIREFDTAQGYGDSERVLGKALAELGLLKETRIISKFDPKIDHLNATAMSKSLDGSLKRLNVPCLFGIMLHREEALAFWNQGLSEILRSFILSGRVKQIGVSVYSPDKAIQALNTDGIDIIQLPTNVLDRRFENAGVFHLANEKKKKVYIRSVFLQGLLLMDLKDIPIKMTFARSVIEKLELLSKSLGLTRQEITMGYIKSEIPHSSIIFGAETSDQIKENVKAWNKKTPASLGNQVRELFANVEERILNPVLWSTHSRHY